LVEQFGFVRQAGCDVTPPQSGQDLIFRFFAHIAVHVG